MNIPNKTITNYYIYAYLDPRKQIEGEFTHEPFYIGLGSGDRLNSHLKESNKLSEKISFLEIKQKRINMIKINKIRKILSEGLTPIIIKIEENLTIDHAIIREKYWISKLGRIIDCSGNLTNITPGGETNHSIHVGPFNSFYGKTHTIEVRQMLSKLHKGKILSDEVKQKISSALKGKKRSHHAKEGYRESMAKRAKNPNDMGFKVLGISRSKNWILQSPDKLEIQVFSLRSFCKLMGLNPKTLMNTLSTKTPIVRGPSTGWMILKCIE